MSGHRTKIIELPLSKEHIKRFSKTSEQILKNFNKVNTELSTAFNGISKVFQEFRDNAQSNKQ